jgi:heme exporter protein A
MLRIIVGLTPPDHGNLHWTKTSHPGSRAAEPELTYIGHTNGLKDDLTVSESLHFLARLHDQDSAPERVANALRRLSIDHRSHLPIRVLSQGQRRRVALARLAMAQDASLWVLDEPFDTLDQDGIHIVNGLIEAHLARQGSVILTSHLPLNLSGVHIDTLDLDEVST